MIINKEKRKVTLILNKVKYDGKIISFVKPLKFIATGKISGVSEILHIKQKELFLDWFTIERNNLKPEIARIICGIYEMICMEKDEKMTNDALEVKRAYLKNIKSVEEY